MKKTLLVIFTLVGCLPYPQVRKKLGVVKTATCVGHKYGETCRVELEDGTRISMYEVVMPGDLICEMSSSWIRICPKE